MRTIILALAIFFGMFHWGLSGQSAPVFQSTGIALLDQAIEKQAPMGLLPLWYKYPYRKVDRAQANEYTAFFVKMLKQHGQVLLTSIPSDIGWYCPKYPVLNQDQRLIFWTRFLSIFPEFETTFDQDKETEETHESIKGIISSGFFQISLASVTNGGYGCNEFIDSQEDLLDWKKNTKCSVKMLSKFMKENNVINWNTNQNNEKSWKGFSRYWGIARDIDMKTPEGRQKLIKYIEKNRPSWIQDGLGHKHPAHRDDEFRTVMKDEKGNVVYTKNGKPKKHNNFVERIIYRMNQIPFCH